MDRSTIDVYEARASEWRDRRPARFTERAEQFGASVPSDVMRADLGCGAGLYLPYLGRPVVALDAARAMLELTRDVASDAGLVQADVEALPLRRGSLGGAWARATYLHIPRPRLPAALAELHQVLRVGAPVHLTMRLSDDEGLLADDDFPGRFFAGWQPEPLRDVLVGAGFVVDELTEEFGGEWLHVRATRARTLPDFVGPGLRVLVVGLNPSEYAADAGVGFARPGNRFWPAAIAAGLVSRDRDPRHALHHHRVGMTDLVKRATPGRGDAHGGGVPRRARARGAARRLAPAPGGLLRGSHRLASGPGPEGCSPESRRSGSRACRPMSCRTPAA